MYNSTNNSNTSQSHSNLIEALNSNSQMMSYNSNNIYYDQSRYNTVPSQVNHFTAPQTSSQLNDDLMMVDLDFSLLMNNPQTVNRSNRVNKSQTYYAPQRPPVAAPISQFHIPEEHNNYSNYNQNYQKINPQNIAQNVQTNLSSDFNTANVDLTSTDLDSILLDDYLEPTSTIIQNYSSQQLPSGPSQIQSFEPTRAQKRPSSGLKQTYGQKSKKLKSDYFESQSYDQTGNYSKYKRYDEFKCWVCGDQSSGNHYGALTCEACKLFFRRHSSAIMSMNSSSNSPTSTSSNASSSSNFTTSNISHCVQRNCQITLQTRSSCPECRYRKCIAVGMGLNRTTFGRHTSIQKSKYNAKCNDLFAEIMKLFVCLKENLGNKLINFNDLDIYQLSNLIIPVKSISSSSIHHAPTHGSSVNNLIVNRYDLEAYLFKFYSDVVDLMTPQKQNSDCDKSQKIPINILITFCLIFGYNLINDLSDVSNKSLTRSNFNLTANNHQLKQILRQIKQIDQQFETFAIRIKIIYFLLIMYTSFSSLCSEHMDDYFVLSINNDEVNDIQRTFLDLLNSELDFQKNTVASTRVSLLLKLDQFI